MQDISLPDGVLLVSINGRIYGGNSSKRKHQQWENVESREEKGSNLSKVKSQKNGNIKNLFSSVTESSAAD